MRRSRASWLKGKGLGLIPHTIPVSERPPEAADRAIQVLGKGLLIICNALNANNSLVCGAVLPPVSERSYPEIHLAISKLVIPVGPAKAGFP